MLKCESLAYINHLLQQTNAMYLSLYLYVYVNLSINKTRKTTPSIILIDTFHKHLAASSVNELQAHSNIKNYEMIQIFSI